MPGQPIYSIIRAIKDDAFASDNALVAATTGGFEFEIDTPGTAKPRIVYSLPDGSIHDTRGYSASGVRTLKREYIFLFTIYANSLDSLDSIIGLLASPTGQFEGRVYTLRSGEVSGGSRWLENDRRLFRNKVKRGENVEYEWVYEMWYHTIVNSPQGY